MAEAVKRTIQMRVTYEVEGNPQAALERLEDNIPAGFRRWFGEFHARAWGETRFECRMTGLSIVLREEAEDVPS